MKSLEIIRIDHFVLNSANVERALEFYAKLPECNIALEKGRGVVHIGKQKINIHPYPSLLSPLAENPEIGGQSFCLNFSGHKEALKELLEKKGIELNKTEKALFIVDADKNFVELSCDARKENNILDGIKSLSLAAAEIKKVSVFYNNLLGRGKIGVGGRIIYNFKYGKIALVYDKKRLGSGDFCLLPAADIEEKYKKDNLENIIKEIGLCNRTGALGELRSFYLRDPEGNLLELANYKTIHL